MLRLTALVLSAQAVRGTHAAPATEKGETQEKQQQQGHAAVVPFRQYHTAASVGDVTSTGSRRSNESAATYATTANSSVTGAAHPTTAATAPAPAPPNSDNQRDFHGVQSAILGAAAAAANTHATIPKHGEYGALLASYRKKQGVMDVLPTGRPSFLTTALARAEAVLSQKSTVAIRCLRFDKRDALQVLLSDGTVVVYAFDRHDWCSRVRPAASAGAADLTRVTVDSSLADFLRRRHRYRVLQGEIPDTALNPWLMQTAVYMDQHNMYAVQMAGHTGETASAELVCVHADKRDRAKKPYCSSNAAKNDMATPNASSNNGGGSMRLKGDSSGRNCYCVPLPAQITKGDTPIAVCVSAASVICLAFPVGVVVLVRENIGTSGGGQRSENRRSVHASLRQRLRPVREPPKVFSVVDTLVLCKGDVLRVSACFSIEPSNASDIMAHLHSADNEGSSPRMKTGESMHTSHKYGGHHLFVAVSEVVVGRKMTTGKQCVTALRFTYWSCSVSSTRGHSNQTKVGKSNIETVGVWTVPLKSAKVISDGDREGVVCTVTRDTLFHQEACERYVVAFKDGSLSMIVINLLGDTTSGGVIVASATSGCCDNAPTVMIEWHANRAVLACIDIKNRICIRDTGLQVLRINDDGAGESADYVDASAFSHSKSRFMYGKDQRRGPKPVATAPGSYVLGAVWGLPRCVTGHSSEVVALGGSYAAAAANATTVSALSGRVTVSTNGGSNKGGSVATNVAPSSAVLLNRVVSSSATTLGASSPSWESSIVHDSCLAVLMRGGPVFLLRLNTADQPWCDTAMGALGVSPEKLVMRRVRLGQCEEGAAFVSSLLKTLAAAKLLHSRTGGGVRSGFSSAIGEVHACFAILANALLTGRYGDCSCDDSSSSDDEPRRRRIEALVLLRSLLLEAWSIFGGSDSGADDQEDEDLAVEFVGDRVGISASAAVPFSTSIVRMGVRFIRTCTRVGACDLVSPLMLLPGSGPSSGAGTARVANVAGFPTSWRRAMVSIQ